MKLPAHLHLEKHDIPYEARSFPPETEKGAANVAHALGFSERQAVKTLIFRVADTGLLGTMLVIPGLANSMIMPFPVISEIIDNDAEQHGGYRREGIFFGMNGGITKLAFSVQGILFAIVTAATGFAEGSDVQTESAIWGIRFLIGVTPIIAALIIAFCMWKYPLGRESHK